MGREKQFFCWLANKLFKLQVLKGILKGEKGWELKSEWLNEQTIRFEQFQVDGVATY